MPASGIIPLVVVLSLFVVVVFIVLLFVLYRTFVKTPYTKKTFEAIWEIEKAVLATVDFSQTTQKVVNIVLDQLGYLKYGYQVIVLTLLDERKNELRRIAISRTESAGRFLKETPIPFEEIVIPLHAASNISVKAITERKMFSTTEVSDILFPALPKEWVRKFQDKLGIKSSLVYPVLARNKVLGTLIFSLDKDKSKIKEEEWSILESFVGAVGIALDNAILFKSLKESSEALAKANEKLQQLDKLKDDFVSVASHELRTPMTAIKSYLWVALKKLNIQHSNSTEILKKQEQLSPEDLNRYLTRAYISVERLINLVNDMLNISRIESGRIALRLSEVDLVELAHEVVEEVTSKAQERGIQLKVAEKYLPKVLCDADKIHEVYLNLIGNSLKFTKAGGTILVDFDKEGSYVYTRVTDSGVGISPENISKLFTKFGKLDNSYVASSTSGGTGLGLFICKSIVELHKGTISCASPGVGQGTTFAFTLPIASTDIAHQLSFDAPEETESTKDLEKSNINVTIN